MPILSFGATVAERDRIDKEAENRKISRAELLRSVVLSWLKEAPPLQAVVSPTPVESKPKVLQTSKKWPCPAFNVWDPKTRCIDVKRSEDELRTHLELSHLWSKQEIDAALELMKA